MKYTVLSCILIAALFSGELSLAQSKKKALVLKLETVRADVVPDKAQDGQILFSQASVPVIRLYDKSVKPPRRVIDLNPFQGKDLQTHRPCAIAWEAKAFFESSLESIENELHWSAIDVISNGLQELENCNLNWRDESRFSEYQLLNPLKPQICELEVKYDLALRTDQVREKMRQRVESWQECFEAAIEKSTEVRGNASFSYCNSMPSQFYQNLSCSGRNTFLTGQSYIKWTFGERHSKTYRSGEVDRTTSRETPLLGNQREN